MSTSTPDSMIPRSRPDSVIGSPDTFHSFPDETAVGRSISAAIVTNNTLPRMVSSTSPVTPTRRGRPPLDRSVSSPHVSLTANRSISRNSPFPSIAHSREWTLFGQLMEDEGQIRPVIGSKIRRRNTQHHSSISTSSHPNAVDQDPFLAYSGPSSRLSPLSADPDPIPPDSPDDDFNEYASDDSYDSDHSSPTPSESESRFCARFQIPTLSRLQKNVLKCGLAYLIASLFTFIPYLSSFLADVPTHGKWERGPSPSGHMVATVYVYQIISSSIRLSSLLGAYTLTLP
jgi:hypothetical protein